MSINEKEIIMIQADIARAQIEAMAMQAENQDRISRGLSIAYTEESFQKVVIDNGIDYNQVIERLDRATY